MLQGQRDLSTVGRLLLTELAPLINAHMGVIYQVENPDSRQLRLLSAYAGDSAHPHPLKVQFGDGLIGQCAMDKRQRLVSDIPSGRRPDQFRRCCGHEPEEPGRASRCCSKTRSRP